MGHPKNRDRSQYSGSREGEDQGSKEVAEESRAEAVEDCRRVVQERKVAGQEECWPEVSHHLAGGVEVVVKEGELHPSWRMWARPASPHRTSLDASQIQEVVREGGGEGERMEDPAKHWWLPQPGSSGGQLPADCGGPLLARHGDGDDDQELVARCEQ